MSYRYIVGSVAGDGVGRGGHRGDIDGLRAVAILAVVGFHSGVPALRGGFLGVDVFFVISGYLIMGVLLREIETTGTISLRWFWARRLRRLTPALTAVVTTTILVSGVLLSALRWNKIAIEGIWSSLYVSNIGFALDARNYFAESGAPSPFLHTWSLAVEEQFYILWPLCIVGCLALRRWIPFRRLLWVVLLLGCGMSFAVSLWTVERGSPWAYYSLPSRWWEIGCGIALALALQRRTTTPVLARVAGIASPVLLLAGLVVLTPTTPFPGVAALLPTAAAAAAIVSGSGESSVLTRVLSIEPLQQIGRVSYSWYIWHWPMLVIANTVVGFPTTVLFRSAVCAASLVPAIVTYRLVERPVRFSPLFQRSFRMSLVLGVLCAVVVGVSSLVLIGGQAQAMNDPFIRRLNAVQRAREERDWGSCWIAQQVDLAACKPGAGVIMLVGDSHAFHWTPGLVAAADELGLPLALRTRGGCPLWDVPIAMAGTTRESAACRDYLTDTQAEIDRLQPQLIVVASASYQGRILGQQGVLSGEEAVEVWTTGVRSALTQLTEQTDAEIVVVLDNPVVPFDPVECLARKRAQTGVISTRTSALPTSTPRGASHARLPRIWG